MSSRKKPVVEPELKEHYPYEMLIYEEDIVQMVCRALAERGIIICDAELEVDESNTVTFRGYGKVSINAVAPEHQGTQTQQQQEVEL